MRMIIGKEPKGINKLIDSFCLFIVDRTKRNIKFTYKGVVREYIHKNNKRGNKLLDIAKDLNKYSGCNRFKKMIMIREIIDE